MKALLILTAALAAGSTAFAQTSSLPCFETNLGTNLGASDNTVVANNLLGFSFPFAGGTITSVDVSSNGFLWLGSNPSGDPRCCDADQNLFLSDPPSIAALWEELAMSAAPAGGGLFFNTFPAAGGNPARAVITWNQIPERNPLGSTPGPLVTVQIQLVSTGEIVIAHDGNNTVAFHAALVGVTQGNGAGTNFIDLSTLASTPVNTGSSQTAFEAFDNTNFDIAGRNFLFLPNGQNGYVVTERTTCRSAGFRPFGIGCPFPPVIYEVFSAGALDLANTSYWFLPNGSGGWAVIPGPNQFFNGFTNNLFLADDSVATVALPFTFQHPAGSTNSIEVCDNGFVWLGSNGSPPGFSGVESFLNDTPRIAPLWLDLDPSSGGAVYADADPNNQDFYITWSNVPEFNIASSNTFQLALHQDGSFELRYQNVANIRHSCLAGYSTGNGALDPGNRDLTATVPFDTGAGGSPLTLAATTGSRPQIGTTFSMDVTNVPNGSLLGFMILGFQNLGPAGIDLTSLGMPGCKQWISLDVNFTFPVSGPAATATVHIPNNTVFIGYAVNSQAATFTPGINALNVVASNGGEIDIGV